MTNITLSHTCPISSRLYAGFDTVRFAASCFRVEVRPKG